MLVKSSLYIRDQCKVYLHLAFLSISQTPLFSINKEKHRPRSSYVCKNSVFSAPSGARTLDTLIKSQVLYQLS